LAVRDKTTNKIFENYKNLRVYSLAIFKKKPQSKSNLLEALMFCVKIHDSEPPVLFLMHLEKNDMELKNIIKMLRNSKESTKFKVMMFANFKTVTIMRYHLTCLKKNH